MNKKILENSLISFLLNLGDNNGKGTDMIVDSSGAGCDKKGNSLTVDDMGHNTNWRYCPGCGKSWEKDSEVFGCWSCGFVRK
jgi:hypothetical protein